MAIQETECGCGMKITVRSGSDSKSNGRRDGKQVVYTDNPKDDKLGEYNIFRCERCLSPITESCSLANYSN